jgi:DNA-binding IclR family transcriptional regulator
MNVEQSPGVKSAVRVLDILEWLAGRAEPASLQQLVLHFGYPKSSALALLVTLVDRGYIERVPPERYRLRDAIRSRWASDDVAHLLLAAHPPMAGLHQRTQETISLGVLDAEQRVQVLAKLISPQEVRYDADASVPRPAYCTAMGRMLLAHAPKDILSRYLASAPFPALTPATVTSASGLRKLITQARKEGVAVVMEEFALGGSGAAAPLFDESGTLVGVLNLATVSPRFVARRATLLDALQMHARQISWRLGWRSSSIITP